MFADASSVPKPRSTNVPASTPQNVSKYHCLVQRSGSWPSHSLHQRPLSPANCASARYDITGHSIRVAKLLASCIGSIGTAWRLVTVIGMRRSKQNS